MKRLVIMLGAILLAVSISALAIQAKTSRAYQYNGNTVYDVALYNDTNFEVYCTLEATNGAYYYNRIQANSWSSRMRINDIKASYIWRCEQSRI